MTATINTTSTIFWGGNADILPRGRVKKNFSPLGE